MEALTAGSGVVSVLALAFAASVAGPHVAWLRGAFGIERFSTLRWPPERPADLDRRYRYDSWHTRFQTVLGAAFGVGVTQQLWSPHLWWVFASAWVIAGLRSVWLWDLILTDGGLGRPRNAMERLLLWSPVTATVLINLTVVLATIRQVAN
jgi:hypothetical protein